MTIQEFAALLVRQIESVATDDAAVDEAAFERRHIIEPAWELSRQHPEIRVFTHPQLKRGMARKRCRGSCESGAVDFSHRVEGCQQCWAASKQSTIVDAFATRHNFDLVAIDRSRRTLAVETKWLSLSDGRGPNGEVQRFIGQCALAAAVNTVVIGVCGFRGRRQRRFNAHQSKVIAKLREIGVILIPLGLPE